MSIELREANDGASWLLAGLATTYGSPYHVSDHRGVYQEQIAPGAFAGAISGQDVVALRVEHGRDAPLASTKGGSLSFRDDGGLALRAILPKSERDVSDAVAKVKRGVLSGLSVGMSVRDDDWSANRARRTIRAARLHEVSLVHEPSNPAATVTGVRAGEEDRYEVRFVGSLAIAEQRADKYSAGEVEELGRQGKAFRNPDGHYSFPINDRADVLNAIHAIGRSGLADKSALRRYIIKRARELNAARLIPAAWKSDGTTSSLSRTGRLAEFEVELRMLGNRTRYRGARDRSASERDLAELAWRARSLASTPSRQGDVLARLMREAQDRRGWTLPRLQELEAEVLRRARR